MVISKVEIQALGPTASDLLTTLKELYPKRLPRRIARDVIPRAERRLDALVDERLRKYPPRVYHKPFVWSTNPARDLKERTANDRARRWWYWKFKGAPHQRTGKLREAWVTEIVYTSAQQSVSVVVKNEAPGASYVFGTVEFNYQQVPSHQATGWPNIGVVAPFIVNGIASSVGKDIQAAINDELTKFAGKGR